MIKELYCKYCKRGPFKSIQSVRAHLGHCKDKPKRKYTSILINPEIWFLAKRNAEIRKMELCDYLEMLIRRDAVTTQLEQTLLKKSGGNVNNIPFIPVQVTHKVERLRRQTPEDRGFKSLKLLCPNCGSTRLRHKPFRRFGTYDGSYYECMRCKHYFSRWG